MTGPVPPHVGTVWRRRDGWGRPLMVDQVDGPAPFTVWLEGWEVGLPLELFVREWELHDATEGPRVMLGGEDEGDERHD